MHGRFGPLPQSFLPLTTESADSLQQLLAFSFIVLVFVLNSNIFISPNTEANGEASLFMLN
uniref:Uncharacterized protein n=1 Tax=Oreochromis aureus TaxID=47969 RepID=A0AAZ1X312_OREAU